MKRVIAHKFCLKHTQNGLVLLFTMFLLLILATLAIAFFYLQFLEVDLIARETEYLQAFYLAEAGLEQGIKYLNDNKDSIKPDDPNQREFNSDFFIQDLVSNKDGYFEYDGIITQDTNDTNLDYYRVIITGKGCVKEKGEVVSKWEVNRREIEKRFFFIAGGLPGERDLPQESFGQKEDRLPITKTLKALEYPVVTSWLEPNEWEKVVFKRKGRNEEITRDQKILLTSSDMTAEPEQRNAYNFFKDRSKSRISKAREIPNNSNKSLFFRNDICYQNYDSFIEGINSDNFSDKYWKYPEFKYREERSTLGKKTLIYPFMTLNRNKQITLKEGLYFFVQLTLEENSILNTKGDVLIYVKKLELKKNAKLMGGTSTDPDNASPNDLIILAQRWDGAYQDPEDGIKIGSTATVCGHILAPSLNVIICKGYMGKSTKVYGSILTYQLVTSRCDAGASPGPIWIIFEEYTNNEIGEIPDSWREVRTLNGIL